MGRGKIVRDRDGSLTDGKKTIRYGDLVRVADGRVGEVVYTRLFINVSRPGKYDRPITHTYRPQAMVRFEGYEPWGLPTYGEMFPFHSIRRLPDPVAEES